MKRNFDFVVVGYAGIDRIIRISQPARAGTTSIVQNADNQRIYFGANGSNISCCLGRIGCSVHLLTRLGGDCESLGYLEMLRQAGVDSSGVDIIEHETTSICHLIEDDEKNHITFTYPGAMNVRYAVREYDDEIFESAKMGVLSVCTAADTIQFLQKCRQHGLPFAFVMRADYESFPVPVLRNILHEAKIIFTNEVERGLIENLYGLSAITDLFDSGVADIIVTTLGARGCVVYSKEESGICESKVEATPGGDVVDATGAGDSFVAGFLYGWLREEPPKVCARYGCTMSSFIIEQVGCITNVPTEQQMLERAKTVKTMCQNI